MPWVAAVMAKDNITESWLCVDCGINTAPRIPNGETMRRQLAVAGKIEMRIDSDSEVYTVRSAVWKKAGMEPMVEKRLGRKLKPKDFDPTHEFNLLPFRSLGTPRLLNRRK
jgi:hypothetical protein